MGHRNLRDLTQKDGDPVDAAAAIEAGHVKVVLHGEKLSGADALTHTRMGGDEKNWMLVKVDDEGADRRRKPTSTQTSPSSADTPTRTSRMNS